MQPERFRNRKPAASVLGASFEAPRKHLKPITLSTASLKSASRLMVFSSTPYSLPICSAVVNFWTFCPEVRAEKVGISYEQARIDAGVKNLTPATVIGADGKQFDILCNIVYVYVHKRRDQA